MDSELRAKLRRQIQAKFKNGSDVTKYLGGNGRPSISKQKKNQILRLSLNNENMGLRPVALKVGVSYNLVNVS